LSELAVYNKAVRKVFFAIHDGNGIGACAKQAQIKLRICSQTRPGTAFQKPAAGIKDFN
jgi:hypothetical protein